MRISTRALVALLASAAATPALAQTQYGAAPAPAPPAQAPAAQSQALPTPKPSKQATKAIAELMQAVNARDTANIPAKVAAAKAAATSRDDRYFIAQLQLKAALAAKDTTAAISAIDEIAASGFLPAPTVAKLYTSYGAELYQARNYDQAVTLFERAAKLEPNNFLTLKSIAEARSAQGRKAEAVASYQSMIQARAAAGQKPEEDLYKRALQIAYEAKLPQTGELARQWVVAYPSADSWRNAIALYRNAATLDTEGTLDLLRLMRAAGAMTPADYRLYVTILTDQLNFIEAQSLMGQASADPQLGPILASVSSKPKVTAADLTAAAKTAQSGMALLRIGDRFYGLGEYAKAAELYRQAKARGVEANLANLRTGVALAAAGDKAGATAALNSVSGPRAEIAKFWLLYLQTRG